MQYPHAYKGVSKIYRSEILMVITGILGLLGLLLGGAGMAAENDAASDVTVGGLAVGAAGLFVVAAILAIVAFVMSIAGINRASKDESTFKKALLWLVIGIAGSAVTGLFSGNGTVSLLGSLLGTISSVLSTYYVISGVMKLADKMGNAEVRDKGGRVIQIYIAVYVLSLVLTIIKTFAGGSDMGAVASGVVAISSAILRIVAYILYLSMLSKAKKMLEA